MHSSIVLLVDANLEHRGRIQEAFEKEGFPVRIATTGPEAIERVLKEKPSFVVLDLRLPGMGGEELCRVLKEDSFLRDAVVLILSESAQLEKKISCFDSGANDFLVKPVDPREVVARVKAFSKLMDDLKAPNSSDVTDSDLHRTIHMPKVVEKERSYPTVDFAGATGTSDSSIRIRPKYGVYRVETLIGSGAMGHVFKAYDEPLERFVAVKILSKRLSSSPAFVERFRREAKVLAAINHPGIAFIYSFGEEEGEHYFAIQWCSGGSVTDLIRKKQRVDVLPALDIILQSARALEAASKKGVVHRDIKPSNILFDENQQVKIVDFGLASSEKMSARITQVQEFLGTPSFMAPEQAQSASVDHRADIYSLGVTFYYMLYGKLPYTAATAIEMVIKHASQAFPSYESLDGKVPKQAFTIIEKMTKKNPEDRYFDYGSLIQDLEQLRNDLLSQSHWKIPKAINVEPVPSLKEPRLFHLLAAIHRQSLSGVLSVRWGVLQKRFLIRQREIVLFESTQPDEDIWQSLMQKNILQKEAIPAKSEDLETSLNRFLLERTFTLQDFKIAYRDLMKAAMMQVFFWPVFEGDFAVSTIEHDAFAFIRITEMMLEVARNLISYDLIRKEIPLNAVISRTSTFETILSTLNLKPEESFVASRFEGPDTTLDTLQLLTGLPEERVARFVYAMQMMGALRFKSEERKSPRKADLSPLSSVQPSGSSSASQTQSKVPTVPEPARPAEPYFPAAARKIVDLPEETKLDAPPGASPLPTPQVRLEVIKSDKILEIEHQRKVADQFYHLAEEKYEWGDHWNAAQLCKQAIKNFPNESKYYHLMARAYAKHPRFGKDAEQCFYKALEIDPWNVDYHLDFAIFYMNNGLLKRAMNVCEKAIKLAPQNEKAKSLYRELTGTG